MKLAAITDEISQDFEHALDVMLEYGAMGAELRGLWGTNVSELTDAQAQQAKDALTSRGMSVVGLATPFYKCDLPAALSNGEATGPLHLAPARAFDRQLTLLQRCAELAHFFGTDFLRVFSFWRKDLLSPAIEEQIANAFDAPLALAEKEGVTLVLENEHACYIGSGAEAARLLGEINSPRLRAVWDPGNAFSLGELPYPSGYEAVKPWIAHVHVKDARIVPSDNPEHGQQVQFCIMGEGEIDYPGQFAALKRDGYTGYLSLETHYVPPTGTGPDGKGTPEDGSRPCLAYLKHALSS